MKGIALTYVRKKRRRITRMNSTIKPYRLPETLKKTIAERETNGAEIRRETGVSEQLISMYIHGKCVPSAYNLFRLANFLDVSADYLLTGEEQYK
jgi:transcriptional regulator with XRE-family HTH domain